MKKISSLKTFFIAFTAMVFSTSCTKSVSPETAGTDTLPVLNQPSINVAKSTVSQYIASANHADNTVRVSFHFTSNTDVTVTELRYEEISSTPTITGIGVNNTFACAVSGKMMVAGLNMLVAKSGQGVDLDTYISYGVVGANGTPSGTISQLKLTSVKCVDKASGNTYVIQVNNVISPAMTLVGSKPENILVTSPNTALSVGMVHVADITMTANTQGNFSQNEIGFVLNTTGTVTFGSTGTAFVKDANNSLVSGISIQQVSSSVPNQSVMKIVFPSSGYIVAAGTTVTFQVYIPVTTLVDFGSGNSISTTINNTGFVWTDITGSGVSKACEGSLIYGFPITGARITK
ncbi:MAG: hypothetical protein WCQ32_01950 [bacterium]